MFGNVDWVMAGGTIITGLCVVFSVLLFLWFSVAVIGNVCSKFIKPQAPKAQANAVQNIQAVQKVTLNQEVVAVITAAVAQTTNKGFKIKSISLQGDSTLLWTGEE